MSIFSFEGIMTSYLLATLPWQAAGISHSIKLLLLMHCVAGILPFAASTIYHLFLCHQNGSSLYRWLLSFDMLGVWAVNTFGYFTFIFSTFHFNYTLQYASIIFYFFAASAVLYFLVTARSSLGRFVPICFFVVARPVLLISRLYLNVSSAKNNELGLYNYVMMDAVALFGAVINVLKFPERLIPGSLDFVLNSHQIMHVCVMASFCFLTRGVEADITFLQHL